MLGFGAFFLWFLLFSYSDLCRVSLYWHLWNKCILCLLKSIHSSTEFCLFSMNAIRLSKIYSVFWFPLSSLDWLYFIMFHLWCPFPNSINFSAMQLLYVNSPIVTILENHPVHLLVFYANITILYFWPIQIFFILIKRYFPNCYYCILWTA